MFICDKCINSYIISGGLERLLYCSRSYGMCEDCHKEKECYDLPSGNYAHKNSLIGESQLKEGSVTIGSLRKDSNNPSRRF